MAFSAGNDLIENVLASNAGTRHGKTSNSLGTCQVTVHKPGEVDNDKNTSYVEYTYEYSPTYNLLPYPNNGMIFSWSVDLSHNSFTAFFDEDKHRSVTFLYDPSNFKIKSFSSYSNQSTTDCLMNN